MMSKLVTSVSIFGFHSANGQVSFFVLSLITKCKRDTFLGRGYS